jgi:hypothetical protein
MQRNSRCLVGIMAAGALVLFAFINPALALSCSQSCPEGSKQTDSLSTGDDHS